MLLGKVKNWNREKKYGFIIPNEGGKDLFFHRSELSRSHIVQVGEIVKYERGTDRNGRPAAVNINNSRAERSEISHTSQRKTGPQSGKRRATQSRSASRLLVWVLILSIIGGIQFCTRTFTDSSGTSVGAGFGNSSIEYRSGGTVTATGTVIRILPDDRVGSKHQKFILQMPGRTLLIAHNIDIAPRISNIRLGDTIQFSGIYEPNDKGGVIHWTHRDPSGNHRAGWLKHKGVTYQ